MMKEVVATAPTVEEATNKAVSELGADVKREDCKIEIIETPKKTIFGKLKGEAVVKASIEIAPAAAPIEPMKPIAPSEVYAEKSLTEVSENADKKLAIAKAYLQEILESMTIKDVKMQIEEKPDGAVITFDGEGMAVLIGHHGETLDALQYLVALTCNRVDGDYYRITLDCGNYREKREATLEGLAKRIAQKVKKTGRSQLLEPMNPYERRIIHAVVSDIEGVFSKSKGEEPNRRVVIMSETPVKTFNKNTNRKEDFKEKTPYVHKRERTMEEILKNDFKDKEVAAELYSKIEL